MTTALSGSMLKNTTITRNIASSPPDKVAAMANAVPSKSPALFSVAAPAGTLDSFRMFAGRNRYFIAMLVSGGLHLGAVAAMLVDWPFRATAEAGPPAAMMVELAVMPASPVLPQAEVAPGPEQVEATPRPIPQEKMQFDPPPQVDSALKPSFALPLKPEIKPLETAVIAKEARQTTALQSVPAPQKEKAEAPVEGNNPAPPSDAEQAWDAKVMARLERFKRYPASAQSRGQEDAIFLRLVIDRKGKLLDAKIKRSRGYSSLDNATLALAMRASPFPQPPASVEGAKIVKVYAIDYFIKNRR